VVQSDTATELQVATANGAYLNSLIQDISNVNYPAISSVKSTLCSGDEQGQVLVGPGCIVGLYHRAAALCHICESWCLFFSETRCDRTPGPGRALGDPEPGRRPRLAL
jgi:hypothetical protein